MKKKDPIEEALTFTRSMMPEDSRPPDTNGFSTTIRFNTEAVEFEAQSPETLILRIKGNSFHVPDKMVQELRTLLGPQFGELAVANLYELSIVKALKDALLP